MREECKRIREKGLRAKKRMADEEKRIKRERA